MYKKITRIILLLSASAVRSIASNAKVSCIKDALEQGPTNLTYRHVAKQNSSECATHNRIRSVSSGTSASHRAPSGLLSITNPMFWNLVTQDFIVLMEGAWPTRNIVPNYVALPQLT